MFDIRVCALDAGSEEEAQARAKQHALAYYADWDGRRSLDGVVQIEPDATHVAAGAAVVTGECGDFLYHGALMTLIAVNSDEEAHEIMKAHLEALHPDRVLYGSVLAVPHSAPQVAYGDYCLTQ